MDLSQVPIGLYTIAQSSYTLYILSGVENGRELINSSDGHRNDMHTRQCRKALDSYLAQIGQFFTSNGFWWKESCHRNATFSFAVFEGFLSYFFCNFFSVAFLKSLFAEE